MRDPKMLAGCLVNGDPALARSSRQRRKAFLISVAFEAAVVAALVLCPLVAPGVLPQRYLITPSPPYRGTDAPESTSVARGPRSTGRRSHTISGVFQPPEIPHHVPPPTGSEESSPAGLVTGPDLPAGLDGATGIFGGTTPAPPTIHLFPKHPPAPSPVVRSSQVQAAALIYRVDPVYPKIALEARLAGTVRLHAIIGTDGDVRRLEVISGPPLLAKAALDAVRLWRYRPTILDGIPVEVETTITVNFVLSSR